VALDGGHRHEAARRAVESREAVLVRHVPERAVESVRPAVIPADEGLLAPGAGRDACPAMPAGVPEGARDAVGPAHREERRTGGVAGDERSGLRQRRRRAERDGIGAQQLELGREADLRSVVLDGLAPHAFANVGRAVIDVVENPSHDRGVVEQWRHGGLLSRCEC
jgi:hypothetical protein